MYINCYPKDELYHFGIPGMRWGIRRFQNQDGSLTAAGRERYGFGGLKEGFRNATGAVRGAAGRATGAVKRKWNGLSSKQKKVIKGAAAVTAAALLAYGGYKLSQNAAVRAGAEKVAKSLGKAGSTAVNTIKRTGKAFAYGHEAGRAGVGIKDLGGPLSSKGYLDKAARAGVRAGNAGKFVRDKVSGAMGSVGSTLGGLRDKVGKTVNGLRAKKLTGPTGTAIKMPTMGDKIRGKVLGAADKVGGAMGGIRDKVGGAMGGIGRNTSEKINKARDYFNGVSTGKPAGKFQQGVANTIRRGADAANGFKDYARTNRGRVTLGAAGATAGVVGGAAAYGAYQRKKKKNGR